MRKLTLLLASVWLLSTAVSVAQTPGTKGGGDVFFYETFNWGNPNDPKGWTAPEGYYFIDTYDYGYNWVWWPAGLGFVDRYTQDPPLNSTSKDDGCLALFLEQYNQGGLLELSVDNYVVFPPFDLSTRSSVVVSFETHFMAYSQCNMYLEISTDNWAHSARYDVSFGCSHKDRPLDMAPGVPALYQANITDVAAGISNVLMRIYWTNTRLYYWAIDDFKLSEAYSNNLKLNYIQMEWDDNDENTVMSWIYNIPKSQLDGVGGFMNFQSSAYNFGINDQEDTYLDLDITKNGTSVFHKTTTPADIWILETDTVDIPDKYSPADFGHYKINWEFKAAAADDFPVDNSRESFFNVTDSVYSRSDNTSELSWSMSKEAYTTTATENLNHYFGSIFPIFGDCEVNSISVFITGGKADQFTNYRFSLYKVPLTEEDQTPYELLVTEMIPLDSAVFNTWVTMPLEKDGESEFLKKGDLVYAGLTFDNTNADHLIRRNQGLAIGTDNSVKLTESVGIAIFDGGSRTGLGDYYGKRNFMIRLGLNDHSNLIDGVENELATASLGQNYPNPFNRQTEVDYELTNGSEVIFEVMDLTGRKIQTFNEGFVPAGRHTFQLKAEALDAGIYFYTIKAGSFVQTKQMVITQ
ncbi:MAG: T9SS type A sorting domain-containing protein [Bacteroidota bacterium]